jgi:hypothetical protein
MKQDKILSNYTSDKGLTLKEHKNFKHLHSKNNNKTPRKQQK